MKKHLYIIAAAFLCMLASCNKEKGQFAPEEEIAPAFVYNDGEFTYISAAEGTPQALGSIDGTSGNFTWNTGDRIAVYSNGYRQSYPLESTYNNQASATFVFDGSINEERADFAVYPASLIFDGDAVRSSSASSHDGASLKITLPSSYTLAQVQGEVSPSPMIAVNEPGGGLDFKSICALLRITVKDIAMDAESITIAFPGQKVNGEFTLTGFVAGTNGVPGASSTVDGDDVITINDLNLNGYTEQLVINIPVPMGTFKYVVVSAYDGSGILINSIHVPLKPAANSEPLDWTPGRKSARKVTACLPVFTMSAADWQDPSNIIHAYIDDPNRKLVVFAPGNLQGRIDTPPVVQNPWKVSCIGTADEWRFAEHQYTAIAASIPTDERTYSYNSLQNPLRGDWVDLFAWMGDDAINAAVIGYGEEYKHGIIYTNSSGPGSYVGNKKPSENNGNLANLWFDWGHSEISYGTHTYERGTWRTPEKEEFRALMNWRCKGNSGDDYLAMSAVKAKINIDGTNKVCGLIIFPDRFSLPYGITINKCHAAGSTEWADASVTAKCSENEFSLAQWQKLEDAGCAFLPFTNVRTWDATNKINVTDYPGDAIYWSTTQHSSKTAILCLAFNDINEGASVYSASKNGLTVSYQGTRQLGYAVRLVRDVK